MIVNVRAARCLRLGKRLPQYPHLCADLLTRVPQRRQYLFRLAPAFHPARLCPTAANVNTSTLSTCSSFHQRSAAAHFTPPACRASAAPRRPEERRMTG
jgi:hypothetical protein